MFYDEDPIQEPEGDNTPAWMLTFADLVSLLICFFVLLYSMKSMNESAWKEITGSFAGALSYNQKFKKMNPNNDSGVEVERILSSDSMDYIQSVLISKFDKDNLLEYIEVSKSDDDSSLHIKIPSQYIFKKDSESFSTQGYEILSLIASSIMYIDGKVDIGSYVKADPEFNTEMKTSLSQSFKIRKLFKAQGVESPVKVVGFGSVKYETMKPLYSDEVVEKTAVAVEITIETKMF